MFDGKLEQGEDSIAAVIREVEEELDIKLKKEDLHKLSTVKVARVGQSPEIDYFSYLLSLDLSQLILQPHPPDGKAEGEGIGWFSAEEIHHLLIRPEDRIAITSFFGKQGT
jgi:8-oxo-dGTP pyrophosphatase MutT (NUDIX family)